MAYSNPFTVEGLTVSTSYTVKVRAYCGEDSQSDWSNEVSFTTSCEAISDLPWNENFDAYTGSTTNTVLDSYPNDELPLCWQFLNRSDNSGSYPQVFISSTSDYSVSGNCLFFKSSSSTPLYAVLPAFEEEIADLQLSFTYRNEGTTINDGTLIVGYMSNPANANTFTEVLSCAKTTSLTVMDVLFTDAPAESYIAFMYEGGNANNYYLSIDNVKVDVIPTCTKPTALECTAITANSATFSWTNGGNETAWQIMLNDDETNFIMAESNPFTVEGLSASTNYTAKVRAYCSADDQSDWSTAVSFATTCDAITTFPWMVDFESFANYTVPDCWDNSASTTTTVSGSTPLPERVWGVYSYEENKMIRMNNYFVQDGTALINTPDLVLPADAEYNLTFDYSHRAGCGEFTVKISTDGGTTFTDLQSYTTTGSYDYSNPGTFTTAEPISLAAYAGQTVILQFYADADYGQGAIFVDNVRVGDPVITLEKPIIGYDSAEGNGFNYYLIASPLADDVDPTTLGMITDDGGTDVTPETSTYDLYRFDQAEDAEWINYRVSPFNLVNGQGYLYASKEGITITFTGTPYSGTTKVVTLHKADDTEVDFPGWNLVGNPFGVTAYIDRGFYTLDGDGKEVVVSNSPSIESMEGVFVVAEYDEEEMTFTTIEPLQGKKQIVLNLTQGRGNTIDRAIVRFGQSQMMPKFMLNENHTKMYIPKDNKDFAMVSGSNNGRLPVNFEPAEDGTYFINVDIENVRVKYLHLIDRETGMDVDLLQNPTYKFEAKKTEKPNRFELVFKTGSSQFKELFTSISGDNFSFCNNGEWIINNDGDAILQVIDINGQILSSESISGSVSKHIDATPGIYMLRLVNGEIVKTQKIIIQ